MAVASLSSIVSECTVQAMQCSYIKFRQQIIGASKTMCQSCLKSTAQAVNISLKLKTWACLTGMLYQHYNSTLR